MEKNKEVEKSIIKKFRKEIYRRFIKAISDYELIKENDNIMVCISGGKDSFLMAKCLQELQVHGKIKFFLHFVSMNPGYDRKNLETIKNNAKILNIPLEIFESDIFKVIKKMGDKPCYLCARMRRGYLYNKARELGCNKIALGHHFNDVIETTLLSMLYSSEIKTMMPKLQSTNYEGIELIRPMYLIKENDIISWMKYNKLEFIKCACPLTNECSSINDSTSKRKELKELIKKLKKENKNIDNNIFTALSNINLNCVLGYRINNKKYNFLDTYGDEKNEKFKIFN